MFAKSLTDKLIGLERYDIISIGTSNKSIGFGTPDGAKNLMNFINPCLYIANIVTPRKMKKAIENVTII
tara:strand:+ start:422 stop:628 length:207 start_codon:yes stop_codon:yes gene_type:complete